MVNEYSNILLIEFDMIVDVDVGIIRLINEEYCDENIFDKEITSVDDISLKGLLHDRSDPNPLQVIMKEFDKELADSLYNQFYEEEMEKIINKSVITSIYEFASIAIHTNGVIDITILCDNYIQRNIVKNILFEDVDETLYNVVLRDKNKPYDVTPYTGVVFKDIRDAIRFDNLYGKNLFIADLMINYDEELYKEKNQIVPNMGFISIYSTMNDIKFMTMYPYDNSYFDNDDYEELRNIEIEERDMSNNPFIKILLGDIKENGYIEKEDGYNKDEDPYFEESEYEYFDDEEEEEEDDFDPLELFFYEREE